MKPITTHQLAQELLKHPDLPFNIGGAMKYLNVGSHQQGTLKVKIKDGVLYFDTAEVSKGYTDEEQQEIFKACLNEANWKCPVNARISLEVYSRLGAEKIDRILTDQIGGGVNIQVCGRHVRVTAPGYYRSIGA